MWIVVGCYTLIFLAVVGCVASAARTHRTATRAALPDEAAGSSLIAEEWDLVRRQRCGPSRCPRATGLPLGPRKDAECVACASSHLDQRWQSLLGGGGAGGRAERPPGDAAFPILDAHEIATVAPPIAGFPTHTPASGRRVRLPATLLGAGALVAVGAVLLALLEVPWMPGLAAGCLLTGGGFLLGGLGRRR